MGDTKIPFQNSVLLCLGFFLGGIFLGGVFFYGVSREKLDKAYGQGRNDERNYFLELDNKKKLPKLTIKCKGSIQYPKWIETDQYWEPGFVSFEVPCIPQLNPFTYQVYDAGRGVRPKLEDIRVRGYDRSGRDYILQVGSIWIDESGPIHYFYFPIENPSSDSRQDKFGRCFTDMSLQAVNPSKRGIVRATLEVGNSLEFEFLESGS